MDVNGFASRFYKLSGSVIYIIPDIYQMNHEHIVKTVTNRQGDVRIIYSIAVYVVTP